MLQVGKSAGDDSVTLVEAAKVLKRVLPLVYPQIIRNTDVKFPRDDRFLEALLKYEVGSPFSPWQEGGGVLINAPDARSFGASSSSPTNSSERFSPHHVRTFRRDFMLLSSGLRT